MDRSMDSIGSCSLDVDAESSDISDTSGSLNFPTPISIKDITREFTNNIRERCSLQTVKNTTAYVDPVTGQVCIALTQPTTTTATVNNNVSVHSHQKSFATTTTITTTATATSTATLLTPQTPEESYDKKPSYLNLACCVNGYSNITTYDSKIRQDINKSREVSPIRPSSTSLQYCKKGNTLAPPVLLAMPNVNLTSPQQQQPMAHQMASTNGVYVTSATIGSRYSIIENNNNSHSQNGLDSNSHHHQHHNTCNDDSGGGGGRVGDRIVKASTVHRSFIQQRVERLYGPGALAQGFYSPKKIKDSAESLNKSDVIENGSELARKFQELSPSKDYNQFRKKLSSTNGRPPIPPSSTNTTAPKEDNTKLDNNDIDLPCLRHLSQEFRAQLPVVSPKRNFSRTSPGRDTTIQPQTHKTIITNGTVAHTMTNTSPPAVVTSLSSSPPSIAVATNNTSNITTKTSTKHVEQNQHYQTPSSSPALIKETSTVVTTGTDELDHKVVVAKDDLFEKLIPAIEKPKVILSVATAADATTTEVTTNGSTPTTEGVATTKPVAKDAHFFLKQLKDEQNRLLIMAADVEKYLEDLENKPDINEDILGLLRSASGKARLLVSQKMKQFEGLCHKNLNSSPDDQFPTTVDDLQGFWDMVYLQVDNVDSIFAEIKNLKKNNWKKPVEETKPTNATPNISKTPKGNRTPLVSKLKPNTPMTNGAGSAVSATPSAAAVKREAQRKKLQEMKRRNREAMAAAANVNSNTNLGSNESSTIEIMGINETSTVVAAPAGATKVIQQANS